MTFTRLPQPGRTPLSWHGGLASTPRSLANGQGEAAQRRGDGGCPHSGWLHHRREFRVHSLHTGGTPSTARTLDSLFRFGPAVFGNGMGSVMRDLSHEDTSTSSIAKEVTISKLVMRQFVTDKSVLGWTRYVRVE
jgi:hypothetical protein